MEDFDFDTSKDDPVSNTSKDDPDSNEDLIPSNEDEDSILKQIDRKIVLKFMKEVRTSRTYVFGLENYLKTKQDRDEFVKYIKKSLGTSVIEKEGETGPAYGFAGDHIKYIYDYIVKKNICPINEIKK